MRGKKKREEREEKRELCEDDKRRSIGKTRKSCRDG